MQCRKKRNNHIPQTLVRPLIRKHKTVDQQTIVFPALDYMTLRRDSAGRDDGCWFGLNLDAVYSLFHFLLPLLFHEQRQNESKRERGDSE